MQASARDLVRAPMNDDRPGRLYQLHPPSRQAGPPLAKLTRPQLFGVLRRERLYGRLDALRRHPVLWVCGPPGAGKTTLVASYIEAQRLPAAWYRVDAADADAAAFARYFGLAVSDASGRKQTSLPPFLPEYLPELDGFLRRTLREAFACLPTGSLLVLDSFQELASTAPLRAALLAAIEEVPQGSNLLLISRCEPDVAMVRHIASQRLGILGWDALRFTDEESRALLCQGDEGEPPVDVQAADGWAAGLVLLREHRARAGTDGRGFGGNSREGVFDYFAGEIFARVPLESQRLLLIAALLPRVPAAWVEALTGNAHAGKVLDQLRRRNLFVSRRGGAAPEYELHSLFREFLAARGRTLLPDDERLELSRRAAALAEGEGDSESALALYCEARDWQGAARLTLQAAPEMYAQGRWLTLAEWVRGLPDDVRAMTPWLTYWLGMAQAGAEPVAARVPLERAYAAFAAAGDEEGQILAAAALAESYYIEFDDFAPLDRWIAALETLRTSTRDFSSPAVELRALSCLLVALLHRQPQHPLLPATALRTAQLIDDTDLVDTNLDANQRVITGAFLLHYYSWVGDCAAAERLVARLQPIVDGPEITPLKRVMWQMRLARHHALLGDAERSARHFDIARSLADAEGLHFYQRIVAAMALYTSLSQDDAGVVRACLARLEPLIEPKRRFDVMIAEMGRAWLALQRDELDTALKHAEAALHTSAATGLIGLTRLALILLAEVHIERGDGTAARHCLANAATACAIAGLSVAGRTTADYEPVKNGAENPLLMHRLQLAEAHLAWRQGDRPAAVAILREAFDDGRKRGYLSNYLWLPKAMRRLCVLALEHGIEADYARALIRKHGLAADPEAGSEWPWPVRVHSLGRFSLIKNGEPQVRGGKTQKRPLELLKGLIALGGRDVDAVSLMTNLWPDAEGDAARASFDTTLHRLRKLLGNEQMVVLQDGKLSLDARFIWVDAWCFERLASEALSGLAAAQVGSHIEAVAERALATYQGHLLDREADLAWLIPARHRLQSRFRRLVSALGERLQRTHRWAEAIDLYQRALELDGLAEEFYRRLILCYRDYGRHAEALSVYRRCRDMLSIVLGMPPSTETETMRRTLGQ